MRSIAALLALLGLVVGGALPAVAVPITYEFSGALEHGFPDADEVAFGTYQCAASAPCGIDLHINGEAFAVSNDDFRYTPGTSGLVSGGRDLFFFQGALADTDLRDFAGWPPVLAIHMIHEDNSSAPMGVIPTDFDFDDFASLELRFVYRNDPMGGPLSNAPFVVGRIESLVSTPEPSTALLVSLGLLGLAAGRARRRAGLRNLSGPRRPRPGAAAPRTQLG
jgi:hypothetical protein